MSEVVPGIAILAVVLANCAPLALAEVGSPLSPGLRAGAFILLSSERLERACLLEPSGFGILRHVCSPLRLGPTRLSRHGAQTHTRLPRSLLVGLVLTVKPFIGAYCYRVVKKKHS